MINYIRSELFKCKYNHSFRNTIIVLLVLSLGVVCLLNCFSNTSASQYCNTKFSLSILYNGMGALIFVVLLMQIKLEFAEEKSNTIKHSVNYGISRFNIYFGKQIAGIFISTVVFILICSLYIGVSYLLLRHSNVGELHMTLRALIASFPVFIAVYAFGQMFLLNVEGSTKAISLSIIIIIGVSMITKVLGLKFYFFKELNNWCIYNLFNKKEIILDGKIVYKYIWYNNVGIIECYVVSAVWFVISNLVGITWFYKKDIR